jgi:hypothetical protein
VCTQEARAHILQLCSASARSTTASHACLHPSFFTHLPPRLAATTDINLQGGYLEKHKRHKPNSLADPSSSSGGPWGFGGGLRDPPSLGPLNPGSLSLRPLNPGALGLGNFTDAIHTNLDLLTLSNVAPGSPRMWLHLVSVYLITLGALKVC